ncbi:hypothetical protein [Salaquimonas pukyongi]|uniref:hypothetical protein n=1 Tax=Salaquimonas pukyongi TaxID=2712698 RepID=UPI00096B9544|nr:hypothetical protein [Salaquimonas pukyongi]
MSEAIETTRENLGKVRRGGRGARRECCVALVLAHQHTTQLSTDVLEAIFGNVGTLMVFRVGATDAGLLANQLAADIPTPRDLINLPNYRMFVKLMIEGRQSKPFSAKTIAPLIPRHI